MSNSSDGKLALDFFIKTFLQIVNNHAPIKKSLLSLNIKLYNKRQIQSLSHYLAF